MDEVRARFESKLQPQENGCINFTGYTNNQGYGVFKFNGKMCGAHRIAWILAGNTIPCKYVIRHKCKQNPACCNLEHLEIGTYSQNNGADKMRDETLVNGERVFTAKLSNERVIAIRGSNKSITDLAKEFGVNYKTIWCIITRRTWKHLSET
jgi:hypothetical protein